MSRPLRRLEGQRILVAEDEVLIVMEIEDMLREIGCEVVGPVATVEAAIAAIRRNDLDGALLDMNLRGERITPAVDELVARGVPFVLCSGYGRELGDEAAFKDAPRLTKPFSLQGLRAVMAEAFTDAPAQ